MKTTKFILTVGLSIFCLTTLIAMNSDITKEKQSFIENVQFDHFKTDSFKVYGNCGMCKKTIEGSLSAVNGVQKSDWNKETKMMEITYDGDIITLKEIKQKIADVGYDTDAIRATKKAYNALPNCCQYERPDKSDSKHNDHNHSH
jgi:copper chaperone CopZ